MHPLASAAGSTAFSRRHFLRSASAGTLAAVAGSEIMPQMAAAYELPTPPGYIDAHVHVWTPDTKAYPLAEGYQQSSMRPPSFTPEELFAHCRPVGVERIVLIQMSFYGDDNRYMLDTLERYPGVFSAVAIVNPHASDVAQRMRELARRGARGFRISPGQKISSNHVVPVSVDAWLGSSGIGAMCSTAADENLAICPLINPDFLPAIDRMCSRYPNTKVVIDHFARIGMNGPPKAEDIDNLCRLARYDKVHVKTSAFYALGDKKAPYTDMVPLIRRLRDAFGAQRLMWASDSPFQVQNGHTYADSIALVRDQLDFLSADEHQWLLRKTAEKVFFT